MKRCLFVMPVYVLGCLVFLQSCHQKDTLFTKLSPGKTNIDFKNIVLEDNERFSALNFPYYYNGGGVAVADFNNDGLPDIVFTGSMVRNRLYINKGNLEFDDVTGKAGIAKYEGWCTGVTIADVNEDGWNDIYICRSAVENPSYRTNLLFINNHDLTFTEKAKEYGLNDSGYSTQASFFDYDKDGDLDLFLIEQSKPEFAKGGYTDFHKQKQEAAQPAFENKLFRNDGGHFTDVTHAAGISSNTLTFSLGVSTADINLDGYPDIYISNDYNEEDYLYINNGNGTFTDQLKKKLDHVALYSMGCDVADYNNDGLPDICTLDMLPHTNYDLKMHSGTERFDKYQQFLSYGFYPFFMRNQLQKNNGDGTFSEIAQLAGIDATNWSWSVLFADYDLDGKKDIFITNGVKRDITNLEYMRFASNNAQRISEGGEPLSFTEFLTHIPGDITPNFFYKNIGNDSFQEKTSDYGLDGNVVSNGAAYADLDNDGDLDIITNNLDEEASVYENNAVASNPGNHFLRLQLKGSKANPQGVGAKIFIYTKDKTIYQEQLLTRGFQSTVDAGIDVGLGKDEKIDSLTIIWPDDKFQTLSATKTNQAITLNIINATGKFDYTRLSYHQPALFTPDTSSLHYQHVNNPTNDFNTQPSLPHFYSSNGPCMTTGDVNGDGREDLYIGGSAGKPGAVFLQQANGRFVLGAGFKSDAAADDMAAALFDADKDGDLDLYVVSGGYEAEKESSSLQDRLYMNDGKGNFTIRPNALPQLHQNKSCIAVNDINGDGFPDMFIGGSVVNGAYPLSTASHILMNDGKGNFTDRTKELCPDLLTIKGIVSSAVWVDINKDGKKDLIVAGEWMPVTTFINNGNTLQKGKDAAESGWWCSVTAADMDGDGDEDIIAGNYGLNMPAKASQGKPVKVFYSDIDNNGTIDPFLAMYDEEGKLCPFVGMDDANIQVPSLRKHFYEYPAYAKAVMEDVYPKQTDLNKIPQLTASGFETVYLENTSNGFIPHQLPIEAQYSPVYAACVHDFNHDTKPDVLLMGNNAYMRLRFGKPDANHGVLLTGDGKGNFTYLPQYKSGLNIRGDVRSAAFIGNALFAGLNGDSIKMYQLQ